MPTDLFGLLAGGPMEFQLTDSTLGDVIVVAAHGDLDVSTAPDLRQKLESALAQGPAELVVDLTAVAFIDSTALGALVAAQNLANEGRTTVSLICSNDAALKLFRITGLDRVFTIRPTTESALTAVPEIPQPVTD